MNKKSIFAFMTATLVAVSAFAATGCGGGDDDRGGHDFVVLAIKEDNVADYNDMPVFKALGKASGKDVFYKFNTSSQYQNNNLKTRIKGIDAIYHAGFSNLQLQSEGTRKNIVAISDYIDDYMPNFKAILTARPDIEEALKSPDGKIYSLPRIEEMGLKAYPNILFLNKAWVEKLIDDGKMPENVSLKKSALKDGLDLSRAQFKAILEKFNELDMNGNGDARDEEPLAFVSGNWQGNESDLIASFGVPENREHKTIIDDTIKFTIEEKAWFNAITEMREWCRTGLIRTSSYERTQDEFLAHGQEGKKYGAFYWWEKETVVKKELQDNYIIVKPLKDDDGKRYVGVSNELEVERSACVILSACKDPGGLLSYFDKFFEPDYSAQLNYGSIESGAFLSEKQNGKLIPNVEHGNQSADDFRRYNAPYGVVYLTQTVWENSVEMEPRAKLRLDRLSTFVKPYTYKGAKSIPNLNYTKDELDELDMYESWLGKNINSKMTSWVTKQAPTEADWRAFLDSNKESIDAIKRINQAAYDRYRQKLGE